MSDVNANIGINFETQKALASLRQLQAGISRFNQTLTAGNADAADAQKALNAQLMQSVNATGKFVSSIKTVSSSTTAFTDALEKNKLSMKEYFRFTAAAATSNTKTFSKFFASERQIFNRAARDRVKSLQSQYIQLTNANGDLVKVLQVVPKHLQGMSGQYADYATKVQMAAQRQQMMNQLIKQGSTQLLNFGKNTQWAGRQLMVGFTIPLTMLGSIASRTFMDMEKEVIKFKKVYGEMFTAQGDTDKAVESIQRLGKEFTKYGIAVKDTVAMASEAAAMGLSGAALTAQVTQATRLAVLGEVAQQDALKTTISLQNAFGISTEQLASKINFLNAVENQTVTAIEDLTIAIPKAGPIVKQLGGSVEDLAYFLTAMKEGGINASEGANALKSGLASIINPTKQTSEMMSELGINIKGIVEANAGNLRMTVLGIAQALDTLDPLARARAIEQMFGKFQFARISALFANITKDSSQAARALDLASMSAEELAIVSERELAKVEDSIGAKFQKTLEELKVELLPLGKAFLEAVTPVVKFASNMLSKFNGLSDGVKKAITVVIAAVGGLAPILLMSVGLVANGVANLIKFFGMLRGGMAKLNGQNNVLGGGFDYLTQQETENVAMSNQLHTSHQQLIETFNVEKISLDMLADAYGRTASQARALASSSPGLFNSPGPAAATRGLKFANGGVVPGTGNKDTVPAMLTPGEVVLTKDTVKNNPEIIAALQNDSFKKYNDGTGSQYQSRISGIIGSESNPAWLAKELSRIEGLSESQLKRFATNTGMATEATLEEIRLAVKDKFASILQDVKNELGKVTQGGLTQVGKRFDQEKGYSPMGSYFTGFDQQQRPQFSHVGQTETVRSSNLDRMNLTPEAQQGLDLLKELGMGGKDFRVADAYGFKLKGSINRAMADPTAAANYSNKYQSNLNTDMLADFRSRGSEKWREMVDMSGGNFDQLKNQLDAFDSSLAQEIQDWITQHPDGLISDDIVIQLASKVESDFQTIGPELHAVIQRAKDTISAIRFSPTEQELSRANAAAEARGMGKSFFGPKTNNAKIANIEARGQGQILGTGIINALRDTTETASPSKKTIEIGKDVARGLAVGMQSEEGNVRSQASQLADASLPQSVKRGAVILGNTNNSSINVLKNTEDLVTSSADAADAQRIHADNVVTASDLAGAAADNTDQIVAATALGANAQMDAAVTAQQIADKDQQILAAKEQQLQAINNNNMQELANDGRLSQANALKEAGRFARDENGQIILGPGGPLTTKQIKDMKRGQRRMAVGKYSGKISGGLGMATMAAGMLGAPPQVTAALGGATMAAQFAPMIAGLTGPQGIALAAVAVAGGLYMLNRKLAASAKAQADYIKSISASTDKMKKIGEITGKVGSSELMARQRQSGQLQGYNEAQRVGQEFGSTFLGSEVGKQMNDSFVANMTKVGAPAASEALGLELASYISDGILTAEQANSIAQQIASNLGNATIGVTVDAQIRKLFGPQGEDLENNPIGARLNLIATAEGRSQSLIRQKPNYMAFNRDQAAQLSALDVNSVGIAQAQSDAVARTYADQIRLAESELASTTNKEKQVKLEQDLARLKKEQADSQAQMNQRLGQSIDTAVRNFAENVQTAGISGAEDAYFDALKAQVKDRYAGTEFATAANTAQSRLSKINASAQGFESGNQAQKFEVRMDLMMANGVLNPQQVNTMLDMFNGQLGELDAALQIGIKNVGAGKSSELMNMLSTVTDPSKKAIAKKIALSILKKNPQEFDKNAKAIAMIQSMDQNEVNMGVMLEIKGETGINELAQNLDKIENIKTPITKEIVQNFIKENPDMPELQTIIDNWDYYGKMDSEILKEAIQRFKTIYEYSTDFNDPEAKQMWIQDQARQAALAASDGGKITTVFDHIYQLTLNNLTGMSTDELIGLEQSQANEKVQSFYGNKTSLTPQTPPSDGTVSGTGKNPLDFLDSLAMRIKNVRDASFNAQKPLQSMLAAFTSKKAQKDASKMFTIFDGLQQRLIKMKAPKEFRDMIMGMSAEDFGKLANLKGDKAIFNFEKGKPKTKANITGLTKTGRALMQTYREAQVGEFQVAQKEILDNVANQDKAFRMLIASGMSASDALAVVNDTAQAAAIASGALGKNGSTEMKQYVKDINAANDALAKQAVITNMIQKAEEFKLYQQMPELASTLAKAGMSADQINAALADPELSKYLIEDLKDGKIDAKEIADYLNSIEARKIIDIQVKYNSGDFAGAAEEGRSLVDEMFSVQEALIRTGVDARSAVDVAQLNANNKELGDLNIKLATAQREVAKMNQELADGQRAIELNYNRPIDDMQEQVNDLERTLETNPIFGNRVIKGLQDESTKLSNDLQVIGFQTEKINEKYDKQAEALQKVQEINQNIIRQQQQQLGLADALTQGDIAAAAKAAQEMRAGDAQMFADTANEALQQSRQNEIDALRGTESGLSATEIADRQFAISQEIYKLENDPNRLAIQQQILDLQDKIYNLGEQRKDQLLKLRDLEDNIYNYNEDIIKPIQNRIDLLTYENTIIQDRIDKLVSEITVLGLNKDEWVKINAKIDASALAAKNLDTAFGALLASATAIDAMWASILAKMASYGGGVPSGVSNAQNQIQQNQNPPTDAPLPAASDSAINALQNQVDTLTDLRTGISNSSALGFKLKEQIDELNFNIANGIVPGQTIVDEQSKLAGMRSSLSAVSRNSSGGAGGMLFMSNGGMVKPKYFARGSFVKGTDNVPAMLTPGEFVMSKYAVNSYGVDKMKAINSGQYSSDSVYNYSVNVSVQSDANPQQIADAVMRQIKQVDSQRIRGNRL